MYWDGKRMVHSSKPTMVVSPVLFSIVTCQFSPNWAQSFQKLIIMLFLLGSKLTNVLLLERQCCQTSSWQHCQEGDADQLDEKEPDIMPHIIPVVFFFTECFGTIPIHLTVIWQERSRKKAGKDLQQGNQNRSQNQDCRSLQLLYAHSNHIAMQCPFARVCSAFLVNFFFLFFLQFKLPDKLT